MNVDFMEFLEHVGRGDALRELTRALEDVSSALAEESIAQDKIVSGAITLKLSLSARPEGVVQVDFDVATKKPKPKRRSTAIWQTPDGTLQYADPRQKAFEFAVEAPAVVTPIGEHRGPRLVDAVVEKEKTK